MSTVTVGLPNCKAAPTALYVGYIIRPRLLHHSLPVQRKIELNPSLHKQGLE